MTIVSTETTQVPNGRASVSDIDPYSDAAFIEPWNVYRELQDLVPAVWLSRYQMFALTRYDSVMRALSDAEAFSSAFGVMMNDDMNQVLRGNTLCSDGEDHRRLRRIIARPLTAKALVSLRSPYPDLVEGTEE
jgi:cytochrome P450